MVPVTRGDTLARRAYASIRQAIRDGGLEHEQIYSEAELGDSMGISRTPVREALIELSREGLIEVLPQRGFRLRLPSDEEIAEVFALREVLEGHVVEVLALQVSVAEVAQLRAVLAAQRAAIDDVSEFLTLDEQFHLLMPQLAGLQRTHGMIVNLRAVMWLTATVALSVRSRAPTVLDEHEAIVVAIERHDPVAASRGVREHLRNTRVAAAAAVLPRGGTAAPS